MLVELAFLLLCAVAGRFVLTAVGMPEIDPSGVVVGTAVYAATVAVLLVIGIPPMPIVAAGIALTVALVFVAAGRSGPSREKGALFWPERRTAISVTLVLATGAVFHPLRLVRDATDASAHLAYAALLQDGSLGVPPVE